MTYHIVVKLNGEVVARDAAWGNTARTARAAAQALKRWYTDVYPEAAISVVPA